MNKDYNIMSTNNELPNAVKEQVSQIDSFYTKKDEEEPNVTNSETGGDQISTSGDVVKQPDTESKQDNADTDSKPIDPNSDYEKRYKNFKASADKTIHQQRLEIQELRQIAEQNKQLMEELQRVKEQQPKFSKEALDTFSAEELEVFNNMLETKTQGLVSEVDRLKAELERTKQEALISKQEEAHQSLKSMVASAVPDFEKIDTSPEFRIWLDGLDSYGNVRMDLLRTAQANKDIARIVSFYNDFKQLQEPVKVDPRKLQQTPQAKSASSNNPESSNNYSGKVWDTVAIQEFYKDVGLGKYTEKKQLEIEREINQFLMNRPR